MQDGVGTTEFPGNDMDVLENFQEEESTMIEIQGGEEIDDSAIEIVDEKEAFDNDKNLDMIDAIMDGELQENDNMNNGQDLNTKPIEAQNPHSTDGYVETPRELLIKAQQEENVHNSFQPNPIAMPLQLPSVEQMAKARALDEKARLEEQQKRKEIKILKEKQAKAATKIQASARGKLARKKVNDIRILKTNAATKIQQYGRKFYAKKKVQDKRNKLALEKQQKELLLMEENERIAKERALKEIERYNKIQEDLLKEQQKQEQEELESISAVDEYEEELPELTPSETQSVQNMGLDEDGEVVSKGKLDVALDYLRSNTVEAQRQMVEEEEEALAKMHEEEEALRLERERQLEIEEYMRLDPVNSHANLIMMDGMNESLLHGASPPAKTPQRLVSISPVYRNKRWQNAAAVLIQSV